MNRKGGNGLKPQEIAKFTARLTDEKKAVNIVVLDMAELLVITDYFLICSGTSNRHVKTLSQHLQEKLKEKGLKPIGKEGEHEGEWVLLDYGGVVIHIFLPEKRDFYRLESLWKAAPRLDWGKN